MSARHLLNLPLSDLPTLFAELRVALDIAETTGDIALLVEDLCDWEVTGKVWGDQDLAVAVVTPRATSDAAV